MEEEQKRTMKGPRSYLPFLSLVLRVTFGCTLAPCQLQQTTEVERASFGRALLHHWLKLSWFLQVAAVSKKVETSAYFPKEKSQRHELSQLAPSIFYTLQSCAVT